MLRQIVLLAGLTLGAQALACDYPSQIVDIPSGETATKEEMVEAQKAVKAYVARMEAYLECLETMLANTENVEEKEKLEAIQVARYNSAVEAMEIVADRFNVEVRTFKDNN